MKLVIPYSLDQDRENHIKANSLHLDSNFNQIADVVNNKWDIDGSSTPIADLSMNGNKLTNLALPTNPADATTKAYVDAKTDTILTTKATKTTLGLVQVGSDVNVDGNGVISVSTADAAGEKGLITLGRTNTIANAQVSAVRKTVVTSTVPTSGEDGTIYFVYAL